MENEANYYSLHWTKLKQLVIEKGGEWSTREDAMDFLTGKTKQDSNDGLITFAETNDQDSEVKNKNLDIQPQRKANKRKSKSSPPVLDKNENYATVHGTNTVARYYQNGHYFTYTGVFVSSKEGALTSQT